MCGFGFSEKGRCYYVLHIMRKGDMGGSGGQPVDGVRWQKEEIPQLAMEGRMGQSAAAVGSMGWLVQPRGEEELNIYYILDNQLGTYCNYNNLKAYCFMS